MGPTGIEIWCHQGQRTFLLGIAHQAVSRFDFLWTQCSATTTARLSPILVTNVNFAVPGVLKYLLLQVSINQTFVVAYGLAQLTATLRWEDFPKRRSLGTLI